MILTHRDDISDHRRWKQRFPALQRIMHMYVLALPQIESASRA